MKSVFAKCVLALALLGGVTFSGWQLTQATVTTTSPRNDYTGNGSTATYSYTFRIFASSDLKVVKRVTSTGVETNLALTTDYTVTGTNKPNGGTITLVAGNLPSGQTMTIKFNRTPQQTTDLRNQGTFFAETHESKFDELTRYAQALTDASTRSLRIPETETGTTFPSTTLPTSVLRASKFLAFDSSGNVITAAGTSANLSPVSGFINTLLDDADDITARQTLGAGEEAPTDLAFRIRGSSDQTKKLAIEVDGFTTATTRTMTIPDRNFTVGPVLATEQLTTSGTSKDFTGILSGTKRITIMLNAVSTNGIDPLMVLLGDAGGFETAGYNGGVSAAVNAGATVVAGATTGFYINTGSTAAQSYSGKVVLDLMDAATFTLAMSNTLARNDSTITYTGAGVKSLSAVIDRVRLTTSNGTNTFDAGSVNISYE